MDFKQIYEVVVTFLCLFEWEIIFIGIVLFSMVCGHLPFEDITTMGLYKKILAGVFALPSFISLGNLNKLIFL